MQRDTHPDPSLHAQRPLRSIDVERTPFTLLGIALAFDRTGKYA